MSVKAINWAWSQDVTPAAKKFILVALADNADDYGICFPSYNTIAAKTGLSRSAVVRNCKMLIEDGFIRKAGRDRANQSTTSNAYLLPFVDGCIDDHPLSILFPTPSSAELPPLVAESYPPVAESYPPSSRELPLEPSLNRHITKREREPLSREEFLRGVNKGFQDGSFGDEFEHLTESEFANQGAECFDRWGDDLKGREPVLILRSWLRKGMSLGTVRKAPKEKAIRGSGEETPQRKLSELQPWHDEIKPLVGDCIFNSWIRPLQWNGNGKVEAPTRFIANWVEEHYHEKIKQVLHPDIEITVKPQETAQC